MALCRGLRVSARCISTCLGHSVTSNLGSMCIRVNASAVLSVAFRFIMAADSISCVPFECLIKLGASRGLQEARHSLDGLAQLFDLGNVPAVVDDCHDAFFQASMPVIGIADRRDPVVATPYEQHRRSQPMQAAAQSTFCDRPG